ncbi:MULTISPECIES: RHS repeat-associated core domain-containing protein [unclassified Rhizobacter]|uniref:RHS repeat-associated core domain-containing protein n=1 Tax=unclassified Rhizobacter TaxID=2640088 RepID=UPI0009E66296|nr:MULTISPECIES: RHS repeat-associated core domain-containing protein [unclassified Rhizobacter]
MKKTTHAGVIAVATCLLLPTAPCRADIPPPLVSDGQLLDEYDQTGKPDHLSAPRIAVDQNGAQRWRWPTAPFGTTAPEMNPDGLGTFIQDLRFPGQYAGVESGPWYNHFRSYDTSKGSYVQADPIGLAGGSFSAYSYVEGNPLALVDPDGLDPWYRDQPWENHPFFAFNKRRDEVARQAEANIRSPNWGKFRANPAWNFIGRFKCNIFVDDMLNRSGAGPGLASNGNPWLAQDWWNGVVPGYERVPRSFVQRGDIAVQRMLGGQGYSGHVGIVVSSNETVSQSSYTNDVDRSPWGFRPHERDQVIFYRCACTK